MADMVNPAFAHIQYVKSLSDKDKRVLLSPMTMSFPAGQITAILGPSGSGKSTLLNFLSGTIGGSLSAKGKVVLSGSKAFVPQNDHLHGFYTCRTYVEHYVRLASSEKGTGKYGKGMVLLASLGLGQHADTRVGDIFRKGLSGGQKRRLSIALEALSGPDTLFLDEPTSGLDAESAYRIIKFLREYASASSNRRVILTIHQPSSMIWKILHHVILLSEGQLICEGTREDMKAFFDQSGSPCPPNYNPADHYVTVVNDEFVATGTNEDVSDTTGMAGYNEWTEQGGKPVLEWVKLFKSWKDAGDIPSLTHAAAAVTNETILSTTCDSVTDDLPSIIEVSGHNETVPSVTTRASSLQATRELSWRYLQNLGCNPGILGTRLVMYSLLSFLIGSLFYDLGSKDSYASVQSRIALMFYCVAFFVFMSVAVMPFTVMERAIVQKEVRNEYYHPACFHFAQAIASLPGTFLLALVTTSIVIGLTGLNAPYWYFLNMFLALNCAEALAHLVSHIVPHFIIGIALVAGIYGMFMLLQGFMIVPSEFPKWLAWSYNIAFHTYSWRTFMYNEFHGDNVTFDSVEFPDGRSILNLYEIENVNPTTDMYILIIYAIGTHMVSFAILHINHMIHKKKQAN